MARNMRLMFESEFSLGNEDEGMNQGLFGMSKKKKTLAGRVNQPFNVIKVVFYTIISVFVVNLSVWFVLF